MGSGDHYIQYWPFAGDSSQEEEEEEEEDTMEVELGSIYQINHSKLTPRTPLPLRSIRLVMVSEKTEWNVSVRYPSIESLKRYFNNKLNEIYPEMDQKFVMDRKLAERVLFRRVPSEEFLVKKENEEFWLVMSKSGGSVNLGDVISRKEGFCLAELKSSGVPGWGLRRQVKFIGRHMEAAATPSSSSAVKGASETVFCDEEAEMQEDGEEEETNEKKDEQKEKEKGVKRGEQKEEERGVKKGEQKEEEKGVKKDEEGEHNDEEKILVPYQRPKRKCCMVNNLKGKKNAKKRKIEKKAVIEKKPVIGKKAVIEKKPMIEKKAVIEKKPVIEKKAVIKKKAENNSRQIVLAKSPMSTRWSDDRYNQAQNFLLEVMKAQGATCEKPIMRAKLRAEARKKIGDTGLLDHLLKHVAGNVAPGGTERFRRRHNTDGAMEYWLESADLVDIRREAGVKDPYWTPPPGWKVGESPTQDPICAREIKELKEENSRLKRAMKDMISRKQMEKELAKLRREMKKLVAKNQKRESQAIVVSNPGQKELVATPTDSSSAKMEKYYKEQLAILSGRYTRIEEELVKLKAKLEGKNSSEQALIALPDALTEKEKSKAQARDQSVIVHPKLDKATLETEVEPKDISSGNATASGIAAAKAAKIERLKSGFRICKPQGTFLWPNNNSPGSAVVQVEDQAVVPTPPSVSSSTAIVPLQLPLSPMRPTPERRAITVTLSSVGTSNFSSTTTTTTSNGSSNKTTTWINLNDVPGANVDRELCGTPSSRQQVVSATANAVPPITTKDEPKQNSAGSCSNKEAGTWLALASPTEPIMDPTRG